MLKASKLLMLGPQDCILQHLLEPEAGPEAGIRNYNNVFSQGKCVEENTQNSWLRLQNCACQDFIFKHLFEPEVGPKGGTQNLTLPGSLPMFCL